MSDEYEVHNDDIEILGPAIDAVNFIKIKVQSVAKRNLGYLRERIANHRKRELAVEELAKAGALKIAEIREE